MKKLNILFAVFATMYIVPATAQEVTVDNSVISIPSGTFMTTGGGITTQNSGGIDNSGNVELKGNWNNNANGLINGSSGTVKFNGTSSQNSGGTSSTNFYNLDVTNTGGVTMQQAESVTNQLTLNSHLRLGNNNLILSAGAPAVAGSLGAANGMVVCNGSGMMRKLYSANGNYLFPLGEITGTVEYSPLQLNFTSGTYGVGGYAEATTINAKHPNNGSNINWLNRYWTVNSSNISSFNCNLTGNYLVADIAGTETAISSARLTGVFNQLTNPWVKYQAFTAAHTLIANNVTQFSSFTGITLANPTVSITGPSSKCTGQPPVTLTANPVGDAVFAYLWSTGATTSSISANPVVNTNYTVTATDANGITAVSNTFTLTVNTSPTATLSNNGNNDICLAQSVSVHLVFTGTGPWNYTISDGVQNIPLVSTVNPDNKNITPNAAGTHNYTVTLLTDAFCSGTATGTAVVTVSSSGPGTVTGTFTSPGFACSGTVSLISVTAVPGQNIHYSWQTGTNSSVVLFSSTGGAPWTAGPFSTPTNQVYAQFGTVGSGQSGYDVCVQGVNGCGSTINRCTWIRGTVSTPLSITPPDGIVACPNDVKNYSCTTSGGATVYTWTLNNLTAPITPNGGNNPNVAVTFPPAFVSGQLCVTAALSCGGSSTSAPRCITITNNPAMPGIIAGPATICPGATGVGYSITPITGASGYSWTVPAGVTITSATNTPSITVDFPTPYNGTPTICVTALNAPCGASPARCKNVASGIPSTPPSITGASSNICGSVVQYSVNQVAGVTYSWTAPAGTTLSSPTGATVQLTVSPTFTSGQLSVTASTALCAPQTSAPRTITIIGKPGIPGVITQQPPGNFCAGAFLNFSVTDPLVGPIPTYSWSATHGTITSTNPGPNNVDVTWGSAGSGNVNVTATNGCGVSGTRSQTFATWIGCREEGINTSSEPAFSIYPNPAHDHVTVSIDVKEPMQFTIKLLDMAGRVLQSEAHDGSAGLNTYDMEWDYLVRGIYMLDVQSGRHSWKMKVTVE